MNEQRSRLSVTGGAQTDRERSHSNGHCIGLTEVRPPVRGLAIVLTLVAVLVLAGCGDRAQPIATYLDTGNGRGQVVYPRAIALDRDRGVFFIVDRLARIQRFKLDGTFLNEWRMPKWSQGKPTGLTVDRDGNLWVPDTHYQHIVCFSPEGVPLKQFGEYGTGPGQFIYPTDVAFDSRGRIFVSEYGDHDRIQVFDKDFKYLFEIGAFGVGTGQFARPQSMVIDGDTLYVTDACNHRIQVFTTDGQFMRTIGKLGDGPGEFRFPYGLEMDLDGDLVVTEFGNNRVQRIDKATGKSLGLWGRAGRQPGELAYPWAAGVDALGKVYVVDAGNNRVQVFRW